MYLIQLNPTPRDGKIYVMYSTVIKKKEKGGDQKRYGHILIKKKKKCRRQGKDIWVPNAETLGEGG